MISFFKTPSRTYRLEVDRFVCNKFGIAEFFTNCFCENDLGDCRKVLDVGCGVGPLAFFLADQFGCTVVGAEINGDACKCFRKNVDILNLSDRVSLVEGDFSMSGWNAPDAMFDLIVSNPPIDDNVPDDIIQKYSGCSYEHPGSSEFMYVTNSWHDDQGKDLLDYLFLFAEKHLKINGRIAIAYCSIAGATEKTVSNRGAFYDFTVRRMINGAITMKSIGAETCNPSYVNAYYVVLQREK